MAINNKKIIHRKLIKPVTLHRTRSASRTPMPTTVIKSVPVVRQPKKTLTPRPSAHAGRSIKRTLNPRAPSVAVRGAPGINDDLVNKLKKSKIGKFLVIVGNGPSAAAAPLEMLAGHDNIDIMSINRPDDRLWPTDYWLFCDNSQYRRHIKLWNSYKGTIINAGSVTKTRANAIRIKSLTGKGFSQNLIRGFHIGRSSVYAAMQAALWMGYDEIYLFGIDMCAVNGKLYSWGSNPDVKDHTRLKRFKQEASHYQWAAKSLPAKICQKYYFCSAHNTFDFISSFNRLDEMEAPRIILEKIKKKHIGDQND